MRVRLPLVVLNDAEVILASARPPDVMYLVSKYACRLDTGRLISCNESVLSKVSAPLIEL